MYVTLSSEARMRKHLKEHPECESQRRLTGTGRSLWWDGFGGGPGEVPMVCEAWCGEHDEEPTMPEYGTPIYESEVRELHSGEATPLQSEP